MIAKPKRYPRTTMLLNFTPRQALAVGLLIVFVVSTTVGALTFGVGWGLVALGLTSGVAAFLLGNDGDS